jgi:para-nitrobenzyl esterase
MKRYTFYTLILSCCILTANAQNPGCDGSRYKADVFTTVKKTTVDYAPTFNHQGQPFTLKMDVYEPEGDNIAQRPVVILAHGGSFIFGDRSNMAPYCQLLAKKGYVAATIQYRLYPFLILGLPDSVDIMDTAVKAVGDMKAAVRYFREDAATANLFKADPNNIFVGGYSAGAVTALHTAYLDASDELPTFMSTLLANNGGLNGISGTASNQTYSSAMKAVVNMSGGLYKRAWINNPGIPMVSIHGTTDQTVPYLTGLAANIAYLEGSGVLHPQANTEDVWNYLETVPGGGHTDIYEQSQFAAQLNNFFIQATTLLESLTCGTFSGTAEEEVDTESMQVSPNPLTGSSIRLTMPESVKNTTIILFDAAGKVAYQSAQYTPGAWMQWPQGLAAGTYTIWAVDTDHPDRKPMVQRLIRL